MKKIAEEKRACSDGLSQPENGGRGASSQREQAARNAAARTKAEDLDRPELVLHLRAKTANEATPRTRRAAGISYHLQHRRATQRKARGPIKPAPPTYLQALDDAIKQHVAPLEVGLLRFCVEV